jgi:hypothetical protein
MPHTLREAAQATGRDRTTLARAIRAGKLSATRDAATGAWLIEPAELHRVYPPEPAQDAAERSGGAQEGAQGGQSGRPIGRPSGAQAAAQVEIRELRAQLAASERSVEDLRRRLDVSTQQLGEALSQVKVLTDQRAPAPPRRRWWRWQ